MNFKENFEGFLREKEEFRDKNYYLNEESQEGILKIQQQKEILMDQLHQKLETIDTGGAVYFEDFAKTVVEEQGELFLIKKGGVREKVSKGDLAIAYLNGFDLRLDESVNRMTKKEFAIRETKARIKNLYNQQLIKAELENKNSSPYDPSHYAFEALADEESRPVYEGRPYGKIAETMVESLMTKLIVDHPELPFTIETADVYDDVRKKMDFKIHLKQHVRGVGVETHEMSGATDTGIQFTLNRHATDHKEEQILRAKANMERFGDQDVDDLVLVSVPIDNVKEKVGDWHTLGRNKPLSGPAALWSKTTQKLIFTKMLEKLPESLNINPEKLWDEVVS